MFLSSYQTDRDQTVGRSGQPTGYDIVTSKGRLVKQFWPGPNETSVPLNISDVGLPFWELLRYARPGPTISVYHLATDAC